MFPPDDAVPDDVHAGSAIAVSEPAPDDVVVVTDVSRTFGRGATRVAALDGLSIRIPRASLTVVLGPSGSGKTTLLHLLAGLDVPDSGTVAVGGVDLSRLGERDRTVFRRRYIGLVFQHSELVPYLTARGNLLLPFLLDKRDPDPDWMARLARVLGIRDRLDLLPGQLSGGEEQRVALGRALATRPEILIADEPHGNLDHRQGEQVLDLLRASTDHFRQTIILATHDPRAIAYADRVLILRDGVLAHDITNPDTADVTGLLTA